MKGARDLRTPRYSLSLRRVRENATAFIAMCDRLLQPNRYEIYFPIKVAPSPYIIDCVHKLGLGLEVISAGMHALSKNCAGAKMILGGPAKAESLIQQGMKPPSWSYVSCESLSDLARVNSIASRNAARQNTILRLKATNKRRLGMSLEEARWAVTHSGQFRALRFLGIHIHSGSNLTAQEADLSLQQMCTAAIELSRCGLDIDILNVGGGMPCMSGNAMEIQRRLRGFGELAASCGATVVMEPGRVLVGDAAELVAEVVDVRPRGAELTINTAAHVIHGPCKADKFIAHQHNGEAMYRYYEVVKRSEANYRIGGIWPAEGDSLWLNAPNTKFTIGDKIIFPHAGAYALGFMSELSYDELIPDIGD